ncbi:hypothetical protein LGL55_04900 [Clostridium tagluense]|nr:hypothetical protein [Clostridium tagluense]MCB2310458.1 hypothetical protein [Clostridium tagluense]MCB2315376.1 hypothetical protein [Clostridium tagluense]MCB2320227.1 hypothetical protein [Clostridium tagluense]MCB2325118.1 hypothetical protein [Clostridium tagluense]MCB2329970.1 hypothetical protein [Clostridium tagluense]
MLNNFKIDGKVVYIRQPNFAELDFIAELWSDEESMNDVGGVVTFPS